jgi:hypothetical protein
MSEPRPRAHANAASDAFAWPPRRLAETAAAAPDSVPPIDWPQADASQGVAPRPPIGERPDGCDWIGVFEREDRHDVPAPHDRPRASAVSLRVAVAVLASIVAVQTIALALLIRRPPTMPSPPPAVTSAAMPPGPTAPAPEAVATAGAATTLLVDGTSGAAVLVDGQRRGVAPLTLSGLAPGKHQIGLTTAEGTVSQEVMLLPSSSASVVFSAPRNGWVDVRTPFPAAILEGSRQIATTADGPIRLPAGTHVLTFTNDDLGYRAEARVAVDGGGLAVVRPTIPQGVLQVNALPWANVFVDGEPAGDTPIGQLRVAVGPHDVRFVHPQYGERLVHVTVGLQRPARVSVDLR